MRVIRNVVVFFVVLPFPLITARYSHVLLLLLLPSRVLCSISLVGVVAPKATTGGDFLSDIWVILGLCKSWGCIEVIVHTLRFYWDST